MIGIQQWLIIGVILIIVFFASPSLLAKFRKTSVNAVREASEFKKDIKKMTQDTDDVKTNIKEIMEEDAKPESNITKD